MDSKTFWKELILNFTDEFSDSFLYAYILQIVLIIYMYSCVGSGRYWNIMLFGSIFGMFAAVTEHVGTAWIDTLKDEIAGSKGLYCYFIAEIGWIATEFSIPYLNLIKLNTLSQDNIIKGINHIIAILFSFFAAFRLYIGYLRVTHKTLYDDAIYSAHGLAFGVTAIADGLLSLLIFHHINKNVEKAREKDGESFNLLSAFKKSSLFILFVVDLMSVILAVLSIFTGIPPLRSSLSKLIKPFHAFKSNFILILAIDAFIFKMRASVEGGHVVSHYLQRQSKLRSSPGHCNDDIPLTLKRYKNLGSQARSVNTMTNSVTNVSVTGSLHYTPSYGTLTKNKSTTKSSLVKKNSDGSDATTLNINMGMTNNIDVFIDRNTSDTSSSVSESSATSKSILKKKKIIQNNKAEKNLSSLSSKSSVITNSMPPVPSLPQLSPSYHYLKACAASSNNGTSNGSQNSIKQFSTRI